MALDIAGRDTERPEESKPADTRSTPDFAEVVSAGVSSARQVPAATRAPIERTTGTDLSAARLHEGSDVDAQLADLGTPGATVGRHVLIRSGLDERTRDEVARHELVHAAQAGVADPDFDRPMVVGRSGGAAERQADRLAGSDDRRPIGSTTPTATSPNVVHGYLGLTTYEKELVRQQAAARQRHEAWVRASRGQFHGELDRQSGSLASDIALSKNAVIMQRVAMIRRVASMQSTLAGIDSAIVQAPAGLKVTVPADLADKWAAAQTAVILVEASLEPGSDTADTTALTNSARDAFVDFYAVVRTFLAAVEQAQRRQQERETAEYRRRQEASRQRASMSYMGVGGLPPLQQPYSAPPARSPSLAPRTARAFLAASPAQWRRVIGDFTSSTAAMDEALIYLSPKSVSKELVYARELLERQEEHRRQHPGAVKIPAVFHPRDEMVDVGPENGGGRAAQSIPWLFYLHRTDDEWVLVDLTSPKRKTNKVDISLSDRVLIEHGHEPEPPTELFGELNSSLRFPKGVLYWETPSGRRWSLKTTEPWTLSTFLMAIGIGLTALGLILLTGGAATPGVVAAFGASAAAGIGSTLAGMSEKAEHGMLTDKDIGLGLLAIAADLLSGLSLGMTKVASISVQAGRLARLSALAGRHLMAVRTADAVLSGAQFLAVTSEFIAQYEAIKDAGLPSDKEDEALARLTLTGLLTGGIMAFSAVGSIRDLRSGTARITVDADGRVRVLDDATPPPRTTDTEVPLSSRAGDTDVRTRETGSAEKWIE